MGRVPAGCTDVGKARSRVYIASDLCGDIECRTKCRMTAALSRLRTATATCARPNLPRHTDAQTDTPTTKQKKTGGMAAESAICHPIAETSGDSLKISEGNSFSTKQGPSTEHFRTNPEPQNPENLEPDPALPPIVCQTQTLPPHGDRLHSWVFSHFERLITTLNSAPNPRRSPHTAYITLDRSLQ